MIPIQPALALIGLVLIVAVGIAFQTIRQGRQARRGRRVPRPWQGGPPLIRSLGVAIGLMLLPLILVPMLLAELMVLAWYGLGGLGWVGWAKLIFALGLIIPGLWLSRIVADRAFGPDCVRHAEARGLVFERIEFLGRRGYSPICRFQGGDQIAVREVSGQDVRRILERAYAGTWLMIIIGLAPVFVPYLIAAARGSRQGAASGRSRPR